MQLLDTKLVLKFCKGEILWNWFKIVSNKQDLHVISFSDCAVIINQPFGVITSPGFPQPYRNGIDCTWNIQLSVGNLIQFNFLHFDIQPGSNLGWTWSWWFTQSSNTIKKYTNVSIPRQFLFDIIYIELGTYSSP